MRRVVGGIATLGLLVGALAAVGSLSPAHARVTTIVASWDMNESAGASTMNDSSGHGLDGSISPLAAAAGLTSNGSYYSWAARNPIQPPVQDERVVTVPDDDRLDIPDPTATYTLELRFRTTHGYGNYVQKGQSTSKGGQIKVQGPGGIVQCLFKGADGTRVGTGSDTALDDGNWHTVRCIHTETQVKEFVDGVRVAVKNGSTGPINNKQPFEIGGKTNCDQVTITCDYFSGDIDYVSVSTNGVTGNQSPVAAFSPNCTGTACTFDSSDSTDPDGSIASYAWDFGDGATSTQSNPSHTFAGAGPFQVVLTVTDDLGATDNATHSVSFAPQPPGKPRSVSATGGDRQATVKWQEPTSPGDSPITQYVATSTPGNKTCSTAALTCTVGGLTNGQSYTFTIVAKSTAGTGPESNATNAVVPAGAARPPSSVNAKGGNGRATVSWSAGRPNGSPVTGYVVTRLPGGQAKTVAASARMVVFAGLTNGHHYHFTVAATNDVGTGPANASRTITPAGPPGRPLHPTAKAGSKSAKVSWQAAAANGARVLKYKIVTSHGQHRTVKGTARQLVFDRLTGGTSYKFRVRAINRAGPGAWSAWTKAVTVR